MSQIDEFLKKYDAAIDEAYRTSTHKLQCHTESALLHLLRRFKDELPVITSERFHKTFRQIDAVDNDAPEEQGGLIDMAFWNLLYPCNLFWKVQAEFIKEVNDGGS